MTVNPQEELKTPSPELSAVPVVETAVEHIGNLLYLNEFGKIQQIVKNSNYDGYQIEK